MYKLYDAHVTIKENMVNCNRKGCTLCPHPGFWYGYIRYGSFGVSTFYLGKSPRLTTLILDKEKKKWRKLIKTT